MPLSQRSQTSTKAAEPPLSTSFVAPFFGLSINPIATAEASPQLVKVLYLELKSAFSETDSSRAITREGYDADLD